MDSFYKRNKEKLRVYAKIDIIQTIIKQKQENPTILTKIVVKCLWKSFWWRKNENMEGIGMEKWLINTDKNRKEYLKLYYRLKTLGNCNLTGSVRFLSFVSWVKHLDSKEFL